MISENLLSQFASNPKQLFLVDGFGALLSAFLLGVVLVQLESYFGIPRNTLYFLALLPCFFAAYDFYCYSKTSKNLSTSLKIIAFSNLIYCFLSIGLAVYHFSVITALGWAYILLEILLLIFLIVLEIRLANKWTSKAELK